MLITETKPANTESSKKISIEEIETTDKSPAKLLIEELPSEKPADEFEVETSNENLIKAVAESEDKAKDAMENMNLNSEFESLD